MLKCILSRDHEMKHDARIAPGDPVNDGGNKTGGDKGTACDAHFPGRGVDEEFNVLHARLQLVEDGSTAFEQRGTVDRGLGPMTVALEQTHAKRMLKVGDHL